MQLFKERAYVAGVDPSLSGTAVSFVKGEKYKYFSAPKETKNTKFSQTHRISIIRKFLRKRFKKHPCQLVVIEGYSYGSVQNRELLGEVGGMIRLSVFWDRPQYVGLVFAATPGQLKKYILGTSKVKGTSATKDKIMMGVYKELGIEVDNNNESDAIVLSMIAKDLVKFAEMYSKVIPKSIDDKELMHFINNGWKEYGFKKYRWEVLTSLITSKGNKVLEFNKSVLK